MKPHVVAGIPHRWVLAVFAAVVASFIAATAFVHLQLRDVDRAAEVISTNTAPSIERLTDARAELRHLQTAVDSHDLHAITDARRALDERVDAYLALPIAASEHELWNSVQTARFRLDHAVDDYVAGRDAGALPLSVAHLYDALTSSIRVNATHTQELAAGISDVRIRTTLVAVGLDIVCTMIAIAGALVLRRVIRDHDALHERHRVLEEERASELEAFSSRVAHDILGPLNTVSFALELVEKPADEAQRKKLVDRGLSAVERIKKLVSGLLDFARAGGKPTVDARADLGGTISEIVEALEPAAKAAHAELVADTKTDALVACNPGVLMSLVTNLARNALKYLGDSKERRVEIRAHTSGSTVRVEVADTGPGIPPDLEERLFEPYVRAPNTRQPGVGLGLATVKRLAEGHGGSVGVDSVPGLGSTFWFELPLATRASNKSSAHV